MMTEKQDSENWSRLSILLPLLLTVLIYFGTTTDRAVIDYDEGYYAQAAKHMVESGDWVTPYANGVRFLEKPPLLYWITAASFSLFGINEFALRLPTALAVIALVWIIMQMARRASGEKAALIAGLCMACSVGTYLFTRETLHDVWLVLFIALALYAFQKWYMAPLHCLYPALLFYVAIAGAMLCKSLVGVAFPIGIVAMFYLLSREWPKWRSLYLVPGSLVFLILTVPWHWLAEIRNEGFLNFFFVGEQFLRFFGKREPPILWSVPLLTFWALVLIWFFPWTAFIPAGFMETWKHRGSPQWTLLKISLAWIVVILGFFSITDRLEHYAFPALPAMPLLIAGTLGRTTESRLIRGGFRGLAVFGILILILGVGVGIWLVTGPELNSAGTGPTNRLSEADFTILADMPADIIKKLTQPAAVTVVFIAVGFPAALWLDSRRRRMLAVICLAAAMAAVCGMIHWSLSICEDLISSKKFGLAVSEQARQGDRLVVVGDYESANSLNFYQPLHVEVVDGLAYALVPGLKHSDAPRTVLSKQEFAAAWNSPQRVFALIPKTHTNALNPLGIEVVQVLHRVLVRNH